ncbi:MAG TPA: hypothetical protein VIU65_05345, partial [Pyrinomonadaceae bacterium]
MIFRLALLVLLFVLASSIAAQRSRTSATVETSSLNREVTAFLDKEILAHLDEIKSYNPPPEKIFNAGTTGEYTWGNFMYALGAYAHLSEKQTVGGHDLAREVGQIGLLEYRLKGTRFSQLYGVLALQFFGRDLKSNPVWQALNSQEQEQWRKFLDVSAF